MASEFILGRRLIGLWLLSAALFVVSGVLVLSTWFGGSTAIAQEQSCDEVTYNESIVLQCQSVDPDSEPSGDGGSTSDDGSSANAEADAGPADPILERARALHERGSRQGFDQPDAVLWDRSVVFVEEEADEVDSAVETAPDDGDGAAGEGGSSEVETGETQDGDGSESASSSQAVDGSESEDGVREVLGATTTDSSNSLILWVWIGLLVLGLAMFAVGRMRQDPTPEAQPGSTSPASTGSTSDGDQKTRE